MKLQKESSLRDFDAVVVAKSMSSAMKSRSSKRSKDGARAAEIKSRVTLQDIRISTHLREGKQVIDPFDNKLWGWHIGFVVAIATVTIDQQTSPPMRTGSNNV